MIRGLPPALMPEMGMAVILALVLTTLMILIFRKTKAVAIALPIVAFAAAMAAHLLTGTAIVAQFLPRLTHLLP